MMQTLSSLVAPKYVIKTTGIAASGIKVGTMTTLDVQWFNKRLFSPNKQYIQIKYKMLHIKQYMSKISPHIMGIWYVPLYRR